MAHIETRLHEHFASLDDSGDEALSAAGSDIPQDLVLSRLPEPFAKVNSVVNGSPADHAGLKAGDEVRVFGYVNIFNHDRLRRVAECVQGNEGVSRFTASKVRPQA